MIHLEKPHDAPPVLLNRGAKENQKNCEAYIKSPDPYDSGDLRFNIKQKHLWILASQGGSHESPASQVLLLRVEGFRNFHESGRPPLRVPETLAHKIPEILAHSDTLRFEPPLRTSSRFIDGDYA